MCIRLHITWAKMQIWNIGDKIEEQSARLNSIGIKFKMIQKLRDQIWKMSKLAIFSLTRITTRKLELRHNAEDWIKLRTRKTGFNHHKTPRRRQMWRLGNRAWLRLAGVFGEEAEDIERSQSLFCWSDLRRWRHRLILTFTPPSKM